MTMPRLPTEELFRVGADGLEPIGDNTLELRLGEIERSTLRRQSDPGYQAAVVEELLQQPEAICTR